MEKNFKIEKLKIRPANTDGLNGVVTHVLYTATITDEIHSGSTTQWCTLPHIQESNFIPIENLTEELVISWILPHIKMEQLDFILERILLKEKYGLPVEIDPPWIS